MEALQGVIRVLQRCNEATVTACRYLTVGLVAAIAVIVCAGVFWRYFLNDALSWTEETAKFLMVWMVFVSAPIALRVGGHASIDALPHMLPPRWRQGLYAVVYLCVLGVCVVLVQQGWAFALNARSQITATTQVSMMYVFGSMPLGGVLMGLVSLELLLLSLVGVFRPERGVHLDIHAAEVEVSAE